VVEVNAVEIVANTEEEEAEAEERHLKGVNSEEEAEVE